MQMRPYRNAHIILVIRDLYFAGGISSFAYRFKSLFPTHTSNDGKVTRQVPVAMVALVATAVSPLFFTN